MTARDAAHLPFLPPVAAAPASLAAFVLARIG
jgi:hypothetical protein